MKATKFLLTLLVGVLIGLVGHWYMIRPGSQDLVINARERMRENATYVGDSLKQSFDTEKITDALARTGKIVREQASKAGEIVTDATANARITAAIKTKLVADSGLAAFKIDVDTNDGVVTLSGTVASPEDVAHAINLALAVEGAKRVVSTLLVKPN